MKCIILITAALFAMLSVAAADEWPPRKKLRSPTTAAPIPKSAVRAIPRPAPARPGVLQPTERDGAQVAPAAAEQPERPTSAGANTPATAEEQREAGGGSPEHNVQPSPSERPGATVGGE
jgi:hypothetical protein